MSVKAGYLCRDGRASAAMGVGDVGPMQLDLLPMPVVALIFAVAGLVASLVVGWLAARFSPFRHDTDLFDTYEPAKLIGGLLALFMVFVLTQSMNYYRAAEAATSKEAGDVLQLDHALAGTTAGVAARVRLREYVRSVIDQEWPAMQRLQASEATQRRLDLLLQAVSDVLTSDAAGARLRNVQKNIDDLEDDRTARIGAAESGLPPALWWTISAHFALLAAAMFLIRPDRRQARTFPLYVIGLSLLAALLFMIDGPYQGSFSVSPRPLANALARLAAV